MHSHLHSKFGGPEARISASRATKAELFTLLEILYSSCQTNPEPEMSERSYMACATKNHTVKLWYKVIFSDESEVLTLLLNHCPRVFEEE